MSARTHKPIAKPPARRIVQSQSVDPTAAAVAAAIARLDFPVSKAHVSRLPVNPTALTESAVMTIAAVPVGGARKVDFAVHPQPVAVLRQAVSRTASIASVVVMDAAEAAESARQALSARLAGVVSPRAPVVAP